MRPRTRSNACVVATNTLLQARRRCVFAGPHDVHTGGCRTPVPKRYVEPCASISWRSRVVGCSGTTDIPSSLERSTVSAAWSRAGKHLTRGCRPITLAGLVRTGAWVLVRRGVYMPAELWRALDPYDGRARARARAAHLQMRAAHVLSHESAARELGMPILTPDTELIHVTRRGALVRSASSTASSITSRRTNQPGPRGRGRACPQRCSDGSRHCPRARVRPRHRRLRRRPGSSAYASPTCGRPWRR